LTRRIVSLWRRAQRWVRTCGHGVNWCAPRTSACRTSAAGAFRGCGVRSCSTSSTSTPAKPLTITVDRRIDADATVEVLDRLVAERQTTPRFIRCENGPELTANALRDWCRFAGAGTSYVEPGSRWQNPYVESFGSRLRGELLSVEAFSTLLEARVLAEDWRIEYNTLRPHSALGYLTRPTTPEPGPPPTPHSHSGWTNNRGPVIRTPVQPTSLAANANSSCQPRQPATCHEWRARYGGLGRTPPVNQLSVLPPPNAPKKRPERAGDKKVYKSPAQSLCGGRGRS
jgi:hypothetical protein